MPSTPCGFCDRLSGGDPDDVVASEALAVALPETRPHASGHTVVVPRRHVARLGQLTEAEHRALFALARRALAELERTHSPDAFTLGMNDGPAAGQSTPHVHLHLVPRHDGDLPDPRGGIRNALPPPPPPSS